MADQRVTVELIAKTRQYSSAMRRAGQDTRGLIDEMKNSESAGIRTLGNIAATGKKIGAGLAAGAAVAIAGSLKAFGDFDAKMTESLAIMGDLTDFQRTEMADAAREVALTTKFSAAEAAESYFFLASAGMDAAQSMEALPAVAAFAQAGMFDLATATDLATDAQSALGLAAEDPVENLKGLTRVTDVFVKANTLANTSVQQVSEAITNKLGGSLRAYNIEVEEGVAVLAAYADQGLKGAAAGEAMNIMLRDLKGSAVDNADAFKRAGIEVLDSSGNFRNMADIVEDLTTAFGHLSVAEQTKLANDLGFQERSFKNIQLLFGQADAIREYEAGLRDASGITEEVAGKQMLTMNEQLGLMKDRVTDIAIGLGQQLAPAFQDEVMPAMEGAIDALGRFAEAAGPALVSVLSGVGKGVEALAWAGNVFMGIFSDDAKTAADMTIAMKAMREEIARGGNSAIVAANHLDWMAEAGRLSRDAVADLTGAIVEGDIARMNAVTTALDYAKANEYEADQISYLTEAAIANAKALVDSEQATLDEIEAAYGAAIAFEVFDQARRDANRATWDSINASEEAGDAIEGMGDSTDGAVQELGQFEQALWDAEEAQTSLADAVKAFTDPTFAAAKAVAALREAEQKAADVAKEAGTDSEEYAAAQLDLAEAVLEAQGALDAFDAGGPFEQIQALAEILDISQEEAAGFLEKLGLIDGTSVSTVLEFETRFTTTGTPPAGIPSGSAGRAAAITQSIPTGRQHGGPLNAGQPAVVGEAGPELFVPSRSGTVLPHSTTVDLLNRREGDRNMNVTFVNSRLADDPMQAIRAALAFDTLETVA